MARSKKSPIARIAGSIKRYFGTLSDIVREHVDYRKQIYQLAWVDLIKTYRGAALGWLWAIIKPTVTIFVYWFAFTVGLRASKDVNGFPFFLWLIAGIVPWFYIQEMLTQGTTNFKRYDYLVTKIRFPLSTISTFVSLSKMYVHGALLLIVIVIFLFFGHPIDIYFIQLPVYIVLMYAFWTLWSLFGSLLSAMSKDFANVVNSFVMAVFWVSGILWDVNKVEGRLLWQVLQFNPVTFLATGYRNVFIYKRWFFEDTFALSAFLVTLLVMAGLALFAFHRLRRDIADVL